MLTLDKSTRTTGRQDLLGCSKGGVAGTTPPFLFPMVYLPETESIGTTRIQVIHTPSLTLVENHAIDKNLLHLDAFRSPISIYWG